MLSISQSENGFLHVPELILLLTSPTGQWWHLKADKEIQRDKPGLILPLWCPSCSYERGRWWAWEFKSLLDGLLERCRSSFGASSSLCSKVIPELLDVKSHYNADIRGSPMIKYPLVFFSKETQCTKIQFDTNSKRWHHSKQQNLNDWVHDRYCFLNLPGHGGYWWSVLIVMRDNRLAS